MLIRFSPPVALSHISFLLLSPLSVSGFFFGGSPLTSIFLSKAVFGLINTNCPTFSLFCVSLYHGDPVGGTLHPSSFGFNIITHISIFLMLLRYNAYVQTHQLRSDR